MYPIRLATFSWLFPKAARKHGLRELSLSALVLLCLAFAPSARAQTGGEGGIQGTVTDSTGAAVPNATVTATNVDTGVSTKRQTTGAGLYTISPILPGTYSVTATAQGFNTVQQKNLTVNALTMTPLDMTLTVGSATTEVTVTAAPPQLETTNATLGMTIENDAYANLPLIMNGSQRDPTAFGTLAPGAQGGARLPLIGGTGNYLGQLYLDGVPAQTVSQQGDNRLVSQAVMVDAVDQMQVVTSTPPAEYSGAGAENFTMKSGGLQYHGSVADFIRNTSLDAWQFVKGKTKPVDHQNELAATFGGHVPGTSRVFFFVAYDRYHNRTYNNAVGYTIPTPLELTGDFTELNGGVGTGGLTGTDKTTNAPFLYDPTTTACSNDGKTCTRQPFVGTKNGVPTYNVIPANYISPIAKAMQQWIPAPTNANSLTGNYTSGYPTGFDNWVVDYRVDFQMTPRHRISTVGAMGTVNYLNNVGSGPYLPLPYTGGDLANIYPKVFDAEDAFTISNSLVNQLKFGYTRFFQNIHHWTQGSPTYSIAKLGVTNLPAGQAGDEFPGTSFGTTGKSGTAVPLQTWTGNGNAVSTQLTTPNNYAIVDNLSWVKGAHSLTFGATVQWQQINNANPATYTGVLALAYNANSTAQFTGSSSVASSTGYSYASFLLGAVGGAPSVGLQPVSEVGGRYFTVAPYAEDTWKVNSKLTIDAGVRWDYLPPYHEVKDRWSFMNPNVTNPATGTPGAIQFAGNYGGSPASCGCRTPVPTYWANWGPRVGITYQTDSKTVFRIGAGRVFSQGGGVGGRGGAFNGTGQIGFNVTATGPTEVTTGAGANPSFYLNNSAYFQSLGIANTDLFGKGYQYPTPPPPGSATQILGAGHYVSGGKFVNTGSISGYADPHFSSRAPDFMFYNAGFQRALTNNMTFALNYVGNQSHHLINSTNSGTGGARGYWTNQLDPKYLIGLGAADSVTTSQPLLLAPANSQNVAKANAIMPGLNIPSFFMAAASAGDTNATIAQGLVAFPQYGGIGDSWGNVGNFSYNSMQVTVQQRFAHGLTFNFNYTWARNVGDDGPYRTGFALPSGSVSGTKNSYRMNRIDRSETTVATPNAIHLFGVWQLPFGRGHSLGSGNGFVSALVSGWQLSGIYTYASGTPVQIVTTGCLAPLQGQCMPDVNPNYFRSPRQNGGYGSGPNGRTAANLNSISYIDKAAFQTAQNVNPNSAFTKMNLIGNVPRTGAFGLRNPTQWNIDTGLRRSIPMWREMAFVFEANAFNTLNHTLFNSPNATFGSGAFGQISGASNKPRAFEVAGHINF